MKSLRDHYAVLELEEGAPFDEVKRTYRQLLQVWHPDRFTGHSELRQRAERRTQELNNAYAALRNHFGVQDRSPGDDGARTRVGAVTTRQTEIDHPGEGLRDNRREDSRGWTDAMGWMMIAGVVALILAAIIGVDRQQPSDGPILPNDGAPIAAEADNGTDTDSEVVGPPTEPVDPEIQERLNEILTDDSLMVAFRVSPEITRRTESAVRIALVRRDIEWFSSFSGAPPTVTLDIAFRTVRPDSVRGVRGYAVFWDPFGDMLFAAELEYPALITSDVGGTRIGRYSGSLPNEVASRMGELQASEMAGYFWPAVVLHPDGTREVIEWEYLERVAHQFRRRPG